MRQDNATSPPTIPESSTLARRAPGPHASQPQLGQVMLQMTSAVLTAHEFLATLTAPGTTPTPSALASEVASRVGSSERLDERSATISVLCELVAREADLAAASAEGDLTLLSGIARRRRDGHLEPWIVKALCACGLDYDAGDLDGLDLVKHPAAQLAARLLATTSATTQARSGYLAQELARVFDAVTQTPTIAEATAQIAELDLDAEALSWAAVNRESHRHVLLVLKEANRAARSWPERQADSFIGYAYQGLRLALRNYDPSRGMFSTYACPRIRGTIRDGVRSESHLPKRLTTFIRKVEGTREKLRHELHRHPTLQEVATALDVELDKLAPLPRYATPASYDDIMARPGAVEPSAFVLDDDPADHAITLARNEAISAALTNLDPDDAQAIQLLVIDELSVTAASELTGLSARTLRARRDRGLISLATMLSDWAPVSA